MSSGLFGDGAGGQSRGGMRQKQVNVSVPFWSADRRGMLRKEISALVGGEETSLTAMLNNAGIERLGHGVYNAQQVTEFIRQACRTRASNMSKSPGEQNPDRMSPKDLRDYEIGLKARQERLEKEGQLLPLAEAQAAVSGALIQLRKTLARVPGDAVRSLPREIKGKMQKKIKAALERAQKQYAAALEESKHLRGKRESRM